MEKLYKIIKLFMFFIVAYGIFTVTTELKPDGKLLLGVMIVTCFGSYALSHKRQLGTDVLFLFIVFLMAITFINSIYYLIRPSIFAADCEGHELMDFSWMTGVFLSPVLTILLAIGYFKTGESKNITDRVWACVCILVFILTLWNPQWMKNANHAIDLFFKPEVVLPEGC